MLVPGDPVPPFHARAHCNPRYAFDSVAGRYVVVSFVDAGTDAFVSAALDTRDLFDDTLASLFLVVSKSACDSHAALSDRLPGVRILWDDDGRIADIFGKPPRFDTTRANVGSWILDPGLRVIDVVPNAAPDRHLDDLRERLGALLAPGRIPSGFAPVLAVPSVFEPDFCRHLIDHCERTGVQESGFMQTDPVSGKTIMSHDPRHKRRRDCIVTEPALQAAIRARVQRRLVPAIERAFQFRATRIERYLIARYDAEGGGHFSPHKDNTTKGTAHRRFAVSIGLHADGYEGGDLRFPEFGMTTYRPTTGGAIVFSCSLLHEVLPMRKGRRFVVLPFLYDEAAAKIRTENASFLDDALLPA